MHYENVCSQFETCWLPAIKITHVRHSKRSRKRQRRRKGWICQSIKTRREIRDVLVASHESNACSPFETCNIVSGEESESRKRARTPRQSHVSVHQTCQTSARSGVSSCFTFEVLKRQLKIFLHEVLILYQLRKRQCAVSIYDRECRNI